MVARSLRRELARHHFPKAQTILAEIGIVIRRCNWPGRLPAERIPNGVAPSPPEAQTLLTAWQIAWTVLPRRTWQLIVRAGMGHGVAHRRAFTDTCLVDESAAIWRRRSDRPMWPLVHPDALPSARRWAKFRVNRRWLKAP
jgi:hypothetical protein